MPQSQNISFKDLIEHLHEQDGIGYPEKLQGLCFGLTWAISTLIFSNEDWNSVSSLLKNITKFYEEDMPKIKGTGYPENFFKGEAGQERLDIKAFVDTAVLYHQATMFPKLFSNSIYSQITNQTKSVQHLFDIIKPKSLQEHTIDNFGENTEILGIYSKEGIKSYLNILSTTIDEIYLKNPDDILAKNKKTITVALGSHNHEVLLVYNVQQKVWHFVGTGQLQHANEEFTLHNLGGLAQLIFDAFLPHHERVLENSINQDYDPKTKVVGFRTTISRIISNDQPLPNLLVDQLNNNEQWKSLHDISKIDEDNRQYLAWLAAENGYKNTLTSLYTQDKTIINTELQEIKAIEIAAQRGYPAIVKMLLENKASLPEETQRYIVEIAARYKNYEVIEMLIDHLKQQNIDIKPSIINEILFAAIKDNELLAIVKKFKDYDITTSNERSASKVLEMFLNTENVQIIEWLLDSNIIKNCLKTVCNADPTNKPIEDVVKEIIKAVSKRTDSKITIKTFNNLIDLLENDKQQTLITWADTKNIQIQESIDHKSGVFFEHQPQNNSKVNENTSSIPKQNRNH